MISPTIWRKWYTLPKYAPKFVVVSGVWQLSKQFMCRMVYGTLSTVIIASIFLGEYLFYNIWLVLSSDLYWCFLLLPTLIYGRPVHSTFDLIMEDEAPVIYGLEFQVLLHFNHFLVQIKNVMLVYVFLVITQCILIRCCHVWLSFRHWTVYVC